MKNDARVRYTKRVLRSALLKLMEEKPINNITVKEVCALAEINRATFYGHYKDCFDLLEQIENELIEDYTDSLKYLSGFDVTELLEAIFGLIERNMDLCRLLVFDHPDNALIQKMIEATHDKSIEGWRSRLTHATEEDMEMLYTCLSNGLMRVVVEGYNRYDKQKLVDFVNTMAVSSATPYL